ncbi:MAG: hypothetical protein K2N05_12100 [Muribaculaceae bacterium]|nr:hypothetical protein [Muribaculaceae bacterium]
MKKLILFALPFMLLLSCGKSSESNKVITTAETFARYANNNHLDSIKMIYPTADFDSVARISIDSISVKDLGNLQYRVNFNPSQWIELKEKEDGSLTVVGSRGVAAFPPEKYRIALQTGMVADSISDLKVKQLLNDSTYFSWLNDRIKSQTKEPIALTQGKRTLKHGVDLQGRPCEGSVERLECTVTNTTERPIAGKDYAITYTYSYYTCSDGSSPDGRARDRKLGVDLAPGESAKITLAAMDYGIKNVAVKFNVPVDSFYDASKSYTGKEYAEYLNSKK